MKKMFLFLFLFFPGVFLGQEYSINWLNTIEEDGKDFSIIGFSNDNIYLEKFQSNLMLGDRVTYKIINKDLKLLNQKKSLFKTDTLNYNYAGTLLFKDKIGQIVWNKNKLNKSNEIHFIYHDINLDYKNKTHKIFEMSHKLNPIGLGLHQILSPDKSKLLVYATSFEKRGAIQDIHYKVIETSTMNLINEGVFKHSTEPYFVDVAESVVDNYGNVIFLSKHRRTLNEIKNGLKDNMVINVIDTNNHSKEYVIREGLFQHSLTLKPLFNGNYALLGLVESKKITEVELFLKEIKGLELGETKKLYLGDIYSNLIENNSQEEILLYRVNEVYFLDNNNISIVLEQFKKTTHNVGTTNYYFSATYGNVINILADKDFNLIKMSLLKKGYSKLDYDNEKNKDILSTFSKDGIYILYNEKLENQSKSEEKTGLFLWAIDSEGNESKHLLMDNKTDQFYPNLSTSFVGEKGLFILRTENNIGILKL